MSKILETLVIDKKKTWTKNLTSDSNEFLVDLDDNVIGELLQKRDFLDQHNIAVRAGFHCVQPYHDKMGGSASVRVSISVYNTEEEIDYLIKVLKKMF